MNDDETTKDPHKHKNDYLVPLTHKCVYFEPNFISPSFADEAYQDLQANTPWEKTAKINRWVTLMELPKDEDSKEGSGYRYRDAPGAAIIGFPETVHKLKLLAEEWYKSKIVQSSSGGEIESEVEFNVCLLNYYEDGNQRIGWHSDREELGRTTPIVSISLGATREFLIRSKTDGVRDRASISMTNGSMVVMENECQMQYLHSVPSDKNVTSGRINLTFRCKGGGGDNAGTTKGELDHERRDQWMKHISAEADGLNSNVGPWQENMGNGDDVVQKVFGDCVIFHIASNSTNIDDDTLRDSMEYMVKTNIGAECYCFAELKEVVCMEQYGLLARPFELAGYVAIFRKHEERDDDDSQNRKKLEHSLLQLRSAHHILIYHDHFDLADVITTPISDEKERGDVNISSIDGEMLYQYYKKKLVSQEISISTLSGLNANGSFRVTCERIGTVHGFQGPEVER